MSPISKSSLAQAAAFGVGVLLHIFVFCKGEWDLAIMKVLSAYGTCREREFLLVLFHFIICSLLG